VAGFENQKIIWNLVTFEKSLILDDDFLEPSLQRKMFSQRMFSDIMRNTFPSLDYCIKLLPRGTDAFIQFIDILIEIKQKDALVLLLTPT